MAKRRVASNDCIKSAISLLTKALKPKPTKKSAKKTAKKTTKKKAWGSPKQRAALKKARLAKKNKTRGKTRRITKAKRK